jgi:hypothetical protein
MYEKELPLTSGLFCDSARELCWICTFPFGTLSLFFDMDSIFFFEEQWTIFIHFWNFQILLVKFSSQFLLLMNLFDWILLLYSNRIGARYFYLLLLRCSKFKEYENTSKTYEPRYEYVHHISPRKSSNGRCFHRLFGITQYLSGYFPNTTMDGIDIKLLMWCEKCNHSRGPLCFSCSFNRAAATAYPPLSESTR